MAKAPRLPSDPGLCPDGRFPIFVVKASWKGTVGSCALLFLPENQHCAFLNERASQSDGRCSSLRRLCKRRGDYKDPLLNISGACQPAAGASTKGLNSRGMGPNKDLLSRPPSLEEASITGNGTGQTGRPSEQRTWTSPWMRSAGGCPRSSLLPSAAPPPFWPRPPPPPSGFPHAPGVSRPRFKACLHKV